MVTMQNYRQFPALPLSVVIKKCSDCTELAHFNFVSQFLLVVAEE